LSYHIKNHFSSQIFLKLTFSPLHLAAEEGETEVTKVLVEAGASLSAVDKYVIKPSVKLRQSNIKLFK
jgi:ankyrin repeat protein